MYVCICDCTVHRRWYQLGLKQPKKVGEGRRRKQRADNDASEPLDGEEEGGDGEDDVG